MAAMSLASYLWNKASRSEVKKAEVEVEYRNRYGDYKHNIYQLEVTKRSSDDRELQIYVIRAGGGIACTLTIRRSSTSEGGHVTMTHSQSHVSGLREEFVLMKKAIREGMHYNSGLYKAYSGDIVYEGQQINFTSQVRNKQDVFVNLPYVIRIRQVY